MKILLWIYAVCGSGYFMMYLGGAEAVVRYATGPLWLMMMLAPVTLGLLVLLPIARRYGLFDF